MSSLDTIRGIGPKMKEKLHRNNIYDCFDIMRYFPSRYEIYHLSNLRDTVDNERTTLEGKVISPAVVSFIRRNFTRLSFKMLIEEREFKVTIFNREFLKSKLDIGTEVVVTGNIDRVKHSFTASTMKLKKNFKNAIEPIYNLDGISDGQFNKFVKASIKEYAHLIQDDLPRDLIRKYKLLSYHEVLNIVHNPYSMKDLEKIDRRVKYEELFKFQFKMQYVKLKNRTKKSGTKTYNIDELKTFIKSLPYELTNDQKDATNAIIKDIKSPYIMNRFLQGDTGSGKTVVAAITMFAVLNAGYQVAFMAPTEILAKQHFSTFKEMFRYTPYEVVYLSGKLGAKERSAQLEKIRYYKNILVVGTHALFSDDVIYSNLGYVITDEQHRFGVNQRRKLREKGFNPDVLYMTATPIPRTLAISLFGDMDITSIREKPKNRMKVETKLFSNKQIDLVYLLIDEQLRLGHQVYVVSPLILESETMDLSNAQKVYSDLRTKFNEYRVGLIHSKISSEDKDTVMEDFKQNKINLLVSTTVIEVGVDVPNATLMVVLDSERFGLSQLHQLRGRIGRSAIQSYCLLVYNEDTENKTRLEIMEQTDDGFLLSEEDLKLRGPGDFFGYRQSGDMKFKRASIVNDFKILEVAREDAYAILTDPSSYKNQNYTYLYKYLKKELKKDNLD